jgi:uncharacterized membrane protein
MARTLTTREKYRTYTGDIDRRTVNVHDVERWVSSVAGGALMAAGLSRRSWKGLALATLGGVLFSRGATGVCLLYRQLGINTSAIGRRKVRTDRAVKIEKAVTIDRPADELYCFWRQLNNLPRVLKHLESVDVKDTLRSHWVVKAPLGMKVEWDAEIITEVPNELIGWHSVGSGDVDNAGSVHFAPAVDHRGTEVRVILQYDPPAGLVGVAMAKILGEDPEQQLEEDLHRFKQMMESSAGLRAASMPQSSPTDARPGQKV